MDGVPSLLNMDKILCEFNSCTLSFRHSQLAIFDSQLVLPQFSTFKINNLHIWALGNWGKFWKLTNLPGNAWRVSHQQTPARTNYSLSCAWKNRAKKQPRLLKPKQSLAFSQAWKDFQHSQLPPLVMLSLSMVRRCPQLSVHKSEAKAQHLCESPNHLRLSQRP